MEQNGDGTYASRVEIFVIAAVGDINIFCHSNAIFTQSISIHGDGSALPFTHYLIKLLINFRCAGPLTFSLDIGRTIVEIIEV